MGTLDHVLSAMPKGESASEASMLTLMTTFNAVLQKQLQDAGVVERLAAEIRSEFKSVGGNLGQTLDGTLSKSLTSAIEKCIGAVTKQIGTQTAEALEGLEQALRAEFKAIKYPDMPKQKAVDLKPIINAVTTAINSIPPPPVSVEYEAPEPRKMSWTFEFIRNKGTGLLEKVIAT